MRCHINQKILEFWNRISYRMNHTLLKYTKDESGLEYIPNINQHFHLWVWPIQKHFSWSEILFYFTSGDIPKNYVVTNFKSVIFVSISCVPISVTFWATMTMKWSKTISWIGRINWRALKVCAQWRAQKLRLIFYMKSYLYS